MTKKSMRGVRVSVRFEQEMVDRLERHVALCNKLVGSKVCISDIVEAGLSLYFAIFGEFDSSLESAANKMVLLKENLSRFKGKKVSAMVKKIGEDIAMDELGL